MPEGTFTPRQKSAYWDTFHVGEQIIDSRSKFDWLVEYRRYVQPDGEVIHDFILFLAGDYIGRFASKEIGVLYSILQEFR